jgi:hypothetical protein
MKWKPKFKIGDRLTPKLEARAERIPLITIAVVDEAAVGYLWTAPDVYGGTPTFSSREILERYYEIALNGLDRVLAELSE